MGPQQPPQAHLLGQGRLLGDSNDAEIDLGETLEVSFSHKKFISAFT